MFVLHPVLWAQDEGCILNLVLGVFNFSNNNTDSIALHQWLVGASPLGCQVKGL
jgi:hypothetical protein